ncbi:SDR family NAD(P)-dependent oxidoreductase [Actinoplanes sp. RD1]|uniref:SDR family NAD(P)-dependent oxidoreductase n=1 Tax=Actinoplanes sp. RD1 TaxID=3064538 RepID=UPI002741C33E|nr:SDR family oxidoreductase [Actinoplanes sp. RD1]
MSRLSTRTAIVTGAAKGIGAAIAKALGSEGAAVVVNYRQDASGAGRVVREITEKGGRAVAVQGDVSQSADVERVFAGARDAFGPVTVLVNNAGIATFEPLTAATAETLRAQVDTNVLGPLLTMQALAAQEDIDGASIINVSTAGTFSLPAYAGVYAATKSALEALTVVAAKELGPRGIRVNAIAPSPTDTEGVRAMGWIGTDLERASIANTPLGRTGTPDDYGPVAAFLASDDARWITGDVLLASGGQR